MIDGMPEARVSFHIGERFKCFQELEKEVKRFQVAISTHFFGSGTLKQSRVPGKGLTGISLTHLSIMRYLFDVYVVVKSFRQEEMESDLHRKCDALNSDHILMLCNINTEHFAKTERQDLHYVHQNMAQL